MYTYIYLSLYVYIYIYMYTYMYVYVYVYVCVIIYNYVLVYYEYRTILLLCYIITLITLVRLYQVRPWGLILGGTTCLNTASFVFHGIACLIRLLESAAFFATSKESLH